MNINLESRDLHSIEAYSDSQIQINQISYEKSLIVGSGEIISDWPVKTIVDLNEETLAPLLQFKPKIIIIGSSENKLISYPLISQLAEKNIGIEIMNIGAASRTFNVLLSEGREVVLGIILPVN